MMAPLPCEQRNDYASPVRNPVKANPSSSSTCPAPAADLLDSLPDYRRAFEGQCEDGYAVRSGSAAGVHHLAQSHPMRGGLRSGAAQGASLLVSLLVLKGAGSRCSTPCPISHGLQGVTLPCCARVAALQGGRFHFFSIVRMLSQCWRSSLLE